MTFFLVYLLIVNATGFLVMTADKHYARKKMGRIPERTLLLWAAIGGSIGVFSSMYILRHKTRHLKFSIGVPLILFFQMAALIFFLLQA